MTLRRSGPPARRTELRRTGRLRPQSRRRRREQSVRVELSYQHLGAPCRLATPVCTRAAEHWHELVGAARGGSRIDQRNLVPACDRCNGWVEDYPARAYAAALKVRAVDAMPGDGGLVPAQPNPLAIASDWS